MEVVAEVVLSVSLEFLLDKLASSDLWKYARQEQIENELSTWKKITKVLDDAEEKQITDASVRAWLADLRNLAYDVDDLLDEFNYEMTRKELSMTAGGLGGADKDDAAGSSSKVRKFFMMPSCCNNFSPRRAKRNVEMGRKMEEITQRLEAISGQKGDLGLENLKREIEGSRDATDQRPILPPLAHEAWVFGRDEDKKKIVAMLLNSPHDDEQQGDVPIANVSVVSIVAMGGMGKTTLADLVYKYVQTPQHFSRKAWVCVSHPFNLETITRQILSCIDPNSKNDLKSLREVQEALSDQLKGERFLIVLDDVWTELYDDWDSLRSPLLNGAPGSKILVTTRNKNVATMMMGDDEGLYVLNPLLEEDCWSVFQIHALENRKVDHRRTLEPIGREIIKKCGGSPLAARALGGLLRLHNRESEWIKIRDSKIWNLSTDKCKILPALTLSFTRLPSYLKRCFAYCAIFPKDYEFDKEELILLWMSEGLLIQPSNDDKREMEDVGSDYFDELCSRSFFQSSSSNSSRYMMHDLINDLANSIAKDTCLHLDDKLKNDLSICNISKTIRHLSITRDQYETFDKFGRVCKKENLCSFVTLPLATNMWEISYISKKVLDLIPRMRHLRVLSLSGYWIREIPDSFGELKHLKYLNLSHTHIECLPNSIGNLYNLQTLILSHCSYLTLLPTSIGTLTSLRCLDVRGAYELKKMPTGIRKLEHLRILPKLVVVGSNSNTSLSIEDLRSMPPLRDQLRISIMENVVGVQDVRKGDLKLIRNLETLVIKWGPESEYMVESNDDESESVESNVDDSAESVLDFLEPHVNLKELCVESYSAPRFPCWVNDIAKFHKMVKLSLVDCRKCEYLPCLGLLPSLECLSIQGMDGVKGVGPEFCGRSQSPSFKALESLSFARMPNWDDWSSSSSSFPRLRELTIRNCPKLIKKLPVCLPSLTKLNIKCSLKFESPLVGLTSLKELEVDKCNVEVLTGTQSDLTSLTTLTISGISGLINLQQGFVGFLGALEDLQISRCPEMISLWEGGGDCHQHPLHVSVEMGLGCNLKSLLIYDCERLERLPNEWQSLTCLEQLSLFKCPELVSFPDHGFPPMLRDVTLNNCEGLKHLPDGMMMITGNSNNINSSCRLECLTIRNCPSLTCFPKGQLPTTLKKLILDDCAKLDSLPDWMMMTNNTSTGPEEEGICCSQLECFEVRNCPSLTCFPNGSLPTTLKQLRIHGCKKLESLPEGIMQKQQHQSSISIPCLEFLKLEGCPSLTSFPQGRFPSTLKQLHLVGNPQLESISGEILFHHSTTTHNYSLLQTLSIWKYPNLTTLPADSLYNLTRLRIIDCGNLELEHNQFKNLTRLTSLEVIDCGNIKCPLSQWGLAILPSLRSLEIGDIFPDAASFSDTTDHHQCYSNNPPFLPPTLTSLEISGFEKLESLASLSLQTLTSLRRLQIENCPKLRSILPREAVLPHTLADLRIMWCPLVTESYSEEEGEYWPQVAHIPSVFMYD